MKGLIYKDLLTAKVAFLLITVIAVITLGFYGVLGVRYHETDMMHLLLVTAMTYMLGMLHMVFSLTGASADEQCGWDAFGNTFPVSRRNVVLSRYAADGILTGVSVFLLFITQLIGMICFRQPVQPVFLIGLTIFCLLVNAVTTPIVYRFGTQKAGYLFAGIFFAFSLLGTGIGRFLGHPDIEMEITPDTAARAMLPFMLGALLVCAVLYGLSIWLSVRIYQKKEF